MSQTLIECKNLVKKYGNLVAVGGLSLDVHKGESFGLLGPNDAGKSTAMKMMYCNALVTSGELYVMGLNAKKNFREIKARIGVVPQEDGLDPDLTVEENLFVYAGYMQMSGSEAEDRILALLRLLKLGDFAESPVDQLSLEMKRCLVIARGLINHPDLLFMDEPTKGLELHQRQWLWDFFRQLKSQGTTIFMTTNNMEEAEVVCDRVGIMDKGILLMTGKPKELMHDQVGKEVVEFDTNPVDLNYYLGRLKSADLEYRVVNDTVKVLIKEHQDSREALALISSHKIVIRKPTLSDVFLKLAGRELGLGQ